MSLAGLCGGDPAAHLPLPEPWLALDTPEGQAGFTDVEGSGAQALKVSYFQVSGLYCAGCSGLIEAALKRLPGVVCAEVNGLSLHAAVRWRAGEVSPSAMVAAVRTAGYDAAPDIAVNTRALRRREQRQALWRLFVAGFCMMQVMMYATPAYVAAPSDMSADIQRLLQWASWVLVLPVLLFAATPFWCGAWNSLYGRRISMDVPVALGLLVTFIASTGATFEPGGIWGHEVYFDSLSMFVFLLLAGRFVDLRLRHRMAARLEGIAACWPEIVQRLDDQDRVVLINPQALRVGDRIRVLVGQSFAADGVILQGDTQADEALLNGESLPIDKPQGTEVVAGSINLQSPVVVRVDRTGDDTRLEGIKALMRRALVQRPAVMQVADRWAGPFLWVVLALALVGGCAWWWIDPARAVWVAVSVLIVTCPCALSLAAPSTWLSAAGALARHGILLTRFEALESLSRIDQVIFDKTGTLTEDRMSLRATRLQPVAPHPGATLEALQAQAGSLAAMSSHPLSRALVQAVGGEGGLAADWHDVSEIPGRGLQAFDAAGRLWRLGALDWVSPAHETQCPHADAARLLWFGPGGQAWVSFEFEEVLRADAAQAVRDLQASGVAVSILSGDQAGRVRDVASQLGIADVHGGSTPEHKLTVVKAAQRAGKHLAMVGDGLNDAPVLALADVSFAVSHGGSTRVAQVLAHADIVLLSPRLSDVLTSRRIACKAMRIARQNLAWAGLYNLGCIPLALAGHLPPWAAGLGMALSSLGVVLNAQRVARDVAPTSS